MLLDITRLKAKRFFFLPFSHIFLTFHGNLYFFLSNKRRDDYRVNWGMSNCWITIALPYIRDGIVCDISNILFTMLWKISLNRKQKQKLLMYDELHEFHVLELRIESKWKCVSSAQFFIEKPGRYTWILIRSSNTWNSRISSNVYIYIHHQLPYHWPT